MKRPGFVPLRYRFILISSLMLVLLMGTLALVLGYLQSRTIRGRIQEQGLAIARNLAVVSTDHLITYNYVALEKLANQAVNISDILYVIFHDKEGKVAGYSRRPDLQSRMLKDEISLDAIASDIPLVSIRKPEDGGRPVMDVAVPVFLPETRDRWGTIRVCLSLELMYQQIRQTFWSIGILGTIALMIGILISNWTAQRVTRPLGTLVDATMAAAKGNLSPEISIHTRDEVEILAANFSYMIQEILAQKGQLEAQLGEIRRLQQYSEKVLDTMSDGLLAVNMSGRVTAVNPAAHRILGFSRALEKERSPVWELTESTDELTAYIREILADPDGRSQREIQIRGPESDRNILVNAGILENGDGRPKEIIFNLNEITALKQLEAEIRQAQRLADLGTLAAGMAHEIRNPLSAIKTYVALLPRKIDKPGFLEKFDRTVPREINRLNNLIEEMLELSRPPKYTYMQTDIGMLLEHCTALLEAEFDDTGVNCRCRIPDLGPILADGNQLEKAFINLMQNGAQAMPEGGDLRIDVIREPDWVTLSFRDTGLGIPPEVAENIFNPFFTTKARGTGLGLAITHKVISEHGGQISLKSRPGEGSCFTVRLPLPKHLGLLDPVPDSMPSFSG